MDHLVLTYKSSLRRTSVPCKLNNVRQTITPWTIYNGLFKIIRVRMRITANENS